MGQPKQLLRLKGQTLLQRTVSLALSTGCRPVILVVQDLAHAADCQGKGDSYEFKTILNQHPERGLSASIIVAVNELVEDETIEAVMFLNCDQPRIDEACLLDLAARYKPGSIVASSYDGTTGSPAIFDRKFFPHLLLLKGDRGAKSVIEANKDRLIEVPMEKARYDLDTEADYAALSD